MICQLFVVPLSAIETIVSLAVTVLVLNQAAMEIGTAVAGVVPTSRKLEALLSNVLAITY